jgi:phosphoribosylaminoimidazole-succinocarboxamide synthase
MNAIVWETSLPGIQFLNRGKVRDLYEVGEHLLIVATDRLSAFDVVLPTPIPDKGRVLTQISLFWFDLLRDAIPNHVLTATDFPTELAAYRTQLDGRAMLCQKTKPLPIECVVRGYLSGSGWKDYLRSGAISGHALPAGLRESERLPEPIFTPATKAVTGHDENIDAVQAAELVGEERLAEVEAVSLELYRFAAEHAAERGLLIADTKFELGLDANGRLVLADEALTPDSSRFWPADVYAPDGPQPSFDKQFARDYCEWLGWNKTAPGPELPAEVVEGTRARYVEAFERLTGVAFAEYASDPDVVLR